MAVFPRGKVWWYKFYFAGQLIRESSKSTSKTVAKNAESRRRRELEEGFNNVQKRRENRVRQLREVANEYLVDYRLRFREITFAEYQSATWCVFSGTHYSLTSMNPQSLSIRPIG